MNRSVPIFLLAVGGLLAGCASPNLKYSDLRPPATATLSGDTITVHVGSDLVNSACFTRPKARVDGQTVFIVGYRTLRESRVEIFAFAFQRLRVHTRWQSFGLIPTAAAFRFRLRSEYDNPSAEHLLSPRGQ